jgi:hypothetical protein
MGLGWLTSPYHQISSFRDSSYTRALMTGLTNSFVRYVKQLSPLDKPPVFWRSSERF